MVATMRFRPRAIEITMLLAFGFFWGAPATAGTADPPLPSRDFDFTYTATLTDLPADFHEAKVWIPIPQTTAAQSILGTRISAPGAIAFASEPKYGNRFTVVTISSGTPVPTIVLDFRVRRHTRSDLAVSTDGEEDSDALSRYLQPSSFVTWTGDVGREAERIAGSETKPIAIAKRLYDHIVDTVRYDQSGEGWGRGDSQYACDIREGNCTDFHSLFIGEARSLGLPSRFLIGFPVPNDAPEGLIGGYHCWAEFYTEEHGWTPIDASEAFKRPEQREALFGGLDPDRVQFTIGRDIALPGMAGEPVNYSIYPYVEVDGEVHSGVKMEFRYRDTR